MFQDTLLIIKPDYIVKRKSLLLCLLQQEFLMKGQRRTCFTPELAAEFYQCRTEDPYFMIQVFLLSKGNSEAFVLAKEYAVEELKNAMLFYFGTSAEMEKNIHVTQSLDDVQREISFIFPNYVQEPIFYRKEIKLFTKNFLMESTLATLYDITKLDNSHKYWKEKLAEYLLVKNRVLPYISNQCCNILKLNVHYKAQQRKTTSSKGEDEDKDVLTRNVSSDISKYCSSFNFATSSCISCSSFDSGEACVKETPQYFVGEIIKARTASLDVPELSSSSTMYGEQERFSGENSSSKDSLEFVQNNGIGKEQGLENNLKKNEEGTLMNGVYQEMEWFPTINWHEINLTQLQN